MGIQVTSEHQTYQTRYIIPQLRLAGARPLYDLNDH